LQELDVAVAVVQAAVDAEAASPPAEAREELRVRLDADAGPAVDRLEEQRVARQRAVRRARVEEEAAHPAPEQIEDVAVLSELRVHQRLARRALEKAADRHAAAVGVIESGPARPTFRWWTSASLSP